MIREAQEMAQHLRTLVNFPGGPRFDSYHSHGGIQLALTLVLGDPAATPASRGTGHTYRAFTFRQDTGTHKIINGN